MTPEKFKSIRKKLAMTQTELANYLGLSLRMVQYYESGEKPIERIAKRFMECLDRGEI